MAHTVRNLASCFFIIIASGCSPALTNLANLGANREVTKAYVQQQKEFFNKLELDLKNGSLKAGTPLDDILSAYGEPVTRKSAEYIGQSAEELLYRHPLKFFSTDMIYLYFDKDRYLLGWEVEPA
ncbi:MAG: hypothetical protein Q8O22_07735 [Candidatus Omnitrophota bacterium]|nr:hypothetical protein [Candidatus Omnitrophota bacterium]